MVIGEVPLKDAYRLAIWGPWRWALERSPDRAELIANAWLGRVAHRALAGQRGLVEARIRAVLGPEVDAAAAARRAFEVHFVHQYVGITFAKVRADNWREYLEIDGREHLDRALAHGRGVVVAHPHAAAPQLPLHVLGLLGYDVHQVGGGQTTVALSRVGRRAAALRATLERRIRATLHDGKAYARPILRVLAANGVVFTAMDGTGGGEELGRREVREVLGVPMRLPPFPVWLAARSGAALVVLIPSSTGGRPPFRAVISAPVVATDALTVLAAHLDAAIRANPGDWHFWDALHAGPGGLLAPVGTVG